MLHTADIYIPNPISHFVTYIRIEGEVIIQRGNRSACESRLSYTLINSHLVALSCYIPHK